MKRERSTSKQRASLPSQGREAARLESYLRASTQASGVPLKVEDAGTVAAFVTLVRSARRAK